MYRGFRAVAAEFVRVICTDVSCPELFVHETFGFEDN
jgi:hypothetical protein